MKGIFFKIFYLMCLCSSPAIAMESDSSSDYSEIHLAVQNEKEPDKVEYPLHFFTRHEKEKEVAYFLQHYGVNDQDERGRTPLHIAALKGNQTLVELLLKARANVDTHDAGGATALDYALALGSSHVAQRLLKKKANPLAINSDGWTPLHTAAFFETDQKVFSSMVRKLHGTLGPRAYAQKYTARQWIETITQQWLQRKKRKDAFECAVGLCKLLQRNPASSLMYEQDHSVGEWAEITARELAVATTFFEIKPEVDRGLLYHWAEQLLPLLEKNEGDFPQFLQDDYRKVWRWLWSNRRGFKMDWIRGGRAVDVSQSDSLKRLAQYYESLSAWELPDEKATQSAHALRAEWLATVINRMKLDRLFCVPDPQASAKERRAWYKKMHTAVRLEPSQEYLVIPSLDFHNKGLRLFISFLRRMVNNQVVEGILILPARNEEYIRHWLEELLHKGSKVIVDEAKKSQREFILRVHDASRYDGEPDEAWAAHLDNPAIQSSGLYITRDGNTSAVQRLIPLMHARCPTFDRPFFVLDQVFSASGIPESTRELLVRTSDAFQMQDLVVIDPADCFNDEGKLLVFCTLDAISRWAELVIERVRKNREHFQKLQKKFVRYAKRRIANNELYGLLAHGIPFKSTLSLSSILIALVLDAQEDLDPRQTLFTAQEWVELLAESIKHAIDFEVEHLMWYALLSHGVTLVCDGEQKSLSEWSSIATEHIGTDLAGIKNMVFQLAGLCSYEGGDGKTPFDLDVTLAHYASTMLDKGHIPADFVNKEDQDLSFVDQTKQAQLMKKHHAKAEGALHDIDVKLVQDFSRYLKEQELKELAKRLTAYRPTSEHNLVEIVHEFQLDEDE